MWCPLFISNFSRTLFSKLWRVVHKALLVLLCDFILEAFLVDAKQTKLNCIVTLCCFEGKTTSKLVYPSLRCFLMGF